MKHTKFLCIKVNFNLQNLPHLYTRIINYTTSISTACIFSPTMLAQDNQVLYFPRPHKSVTNKKYMKIDQMKVRPDFSFFFSFFFTRRSPMIEFVGCGSRSVVGEPPTQHRQAVTVSWWDFYQFEAGKARNSAEFRA